MYGVKCTGAGIVLIALFGWIGFELARVEASIGAGIGVKEFGWLFDGS